MVTYKTAAATVKEGKRRQQTALKAEELNLERGLNVHKLMRGAQLQLDAHVELFQSNDCKQCLSP